MAAQAGAIPEAALSEPNVAAVATHVTPVQRTQVSAVLAFGTQGVHPFNRQEPDRVYVCRVEDISKSHVIKKVVAFYRHEDLPFSELLQKAARKFQVEVGARSKLYLMSPETWQPLAEVDELIDIRDGEDLALDVKGNWLEKQQLAQELDAQQPLASVGGVIAQITVQTNEMTTATAAARHPPQIGLTDSDNLTSTSISAPEAATEIAKLPVRHDVRAGCKRKKADDESIASMLEPEHMVQAVADGRLCGDIEKLLCHVASRGTLPKNNSRLCFVCGNDCRELCNICGTILHYTNIQRGMKVPCFLQYHNTCYFGLARGDWKITTTKKQQFTLPDDDLRQTHADAMRELHAKTSRICSNSHVTLPSSNPTNLACSIPTLAQADNMPPILNNSNVTLADSNSGNNDNEQESNSDNDGFQGISRSAPI